MKPNIELDLPHNLFAYALSAAVFASARSNRSHLWYSDKRRHEAAHRWTSDVYYGKRRWQKANERNTFVMHIGTAKAKTIQQSIRETPQMGRSTAIKRRKFNKLIVLCENECGIVSMGVRSPDDDAVHCDCQRRCAMPWFLFLLVFGVRGRTACAID